MPISREKCYERVSKEGRSTMMSRVHMRLPKLDKPTRRKKQSRSRIDLAAPCTKSVLLAQDEWESPERVPPPIQCTSCQQRPDMSCLQESPPTIGHGVAHHASAAGRLVPKLSLRGVRPPLSPASWEVTGRLVSLVRTQTGGYAGVTPCPREFIGICPQNRASLAGLICTLNVSA
jgi:hypothetical protein